MENIKKTISENIIKLRKQNNFTQAQLAEKIHYSDKAVSRWENGEVLPDIETLNKLAEIFEVEIESFFTKELNSQAAKRLGRIKKNNRLIISLLSICAVWIIATVIHVNINVILKFNIWEIYIYAVPVSCITAIVFSSLWGTKFWKFFFISGLVWSLLISLFIMFLSYNIWPVFIVGAPLQVAIILWSKL